MKSLFLKLYLLKHKECKYKPSKASNSIEWNYKGKEDQIVGIT